MKRRVLLTLTSAFVLASCQNEVPLDASSSNQISEVPSVSSSEAPISSEPDDGLDEVFLTLEDNLKPFVKGDKNGFKINPVGDDPLFKLSFKTDGEIASTNAAGSSSTIGEGEPEIKTYSIELDCEESTIETFNRTKKRGYCNRMTFENAEISVVRENSHLIDLNQTYVGYLAQTEIAGTNPKEYENGLYIDLSRATLSRVTFAPLFNKLILPAKNYIDMGTVFEGLQELFPMATTLNTLLPSALDLLKEEVRSGVLTLDKKTTNKIEEYKIHREIESKQALRNKIDEIVEEAFKDTTIDLDRDDVNDVIDAAFDQIKSISGDFEINFNENEFKDVVLDFNVKLEDILPEDMEDLGFYFSLNDFVVSSKITLMDPKDVDFSTYPTDLQNHNTWKELSL